MAERIQRSKGGDRDSTRIETTESDLDATTEQGDRLKAEMDDILDEIDDVLETNAEDFVKSYVQKGGE
ncbi:MAG: prokaryotic ubiquitin-like protein Pup [Actinomycetota bacterium]|jgi:ubiquitin-like protein Pup